jgi:hypothetical protein
VPLGSTPNLSARFTFVTPNLRNDMHYSMLRTTEELRGLGFLGNAANAASMRGAFNL